jgi:undecaprenyl-diphosphatase
MLAWRIFGDTVTSIGLYKLLVGLVLGIIQGISEWLPVSSKTQILLASNFLLKLSFSQAYALGLFLEGGTFIAAIIYFRKEIWKTILAVFGKGGSEGRLLLKYIVIVTVITAIVAIPIYKYVSSLPGPAIGTPMIVLGVLLIFDGVLVKFTKSVHGAGKTLGKLSIIDMVLVGIAQGISALPGISRSGITVSSLIFLKIKPEEAFRLSFFALIPASIGATAVTLIFSHPVVAYALNTLTIPGLVVAVIASTIISLILINWLIKFAGTSRMTSIVFILGIIAIAGGIVSLIVGVG